MKAPLFKNSYSSLSLKKLLRLLYNKNLFIFKKIIDGLGALKKIKTILKPAENR